MTRVHLEFCSGKDNRRTYGRKVEEYIADFCLVSRRSLTGIELDIFRYHFLLGADWKLCCWRLKLDRGSFFHYVYRIEQKLGRIFRELEPYSLFPLNEYFSGTSREAARVGCRAAPVIPMRPWKPILRPPLQRSAA